MSALSDGEIKELSSTRMSLLEWLSFIVENQIVIKPLDVNLHTYLSNSRFGSIKVPCHFFQPEFGIHPNSTFTDAILEKAVEKAYIYYYQHMFKPMITPYVDESVRKVGDARLMSYGVSSYGYDVRLGEDVKIFSNINAGIIDPKNFDERCLVTPEVHVDGTAKYVLLPPNSYLLGATPEWFNIPRNIITVALGKSTYARSGIIVNVTPIEPGFEGNVVVEISNGTSLPAKVYLNEGIAQFIFFKGSKPCRTSYGDRDGKYQGQTGVTLPRV